MGRIEDIPRHEIESVYSEDNEYRKFYYALFFMEPTQPDLAYHILRDKVDDGNN